MFVAEKSTTILQQLSIVNPDLVAKRGWYITGNWGDTLVTTLYPPNAYNKVALAATAAWTDSASSLHAGGLNLLMGDGSVRFIKNSIESWPSDPVTGVPAGSSMTPAGLWIEAFPARRVAGVLNATPMARRSSPASSDPSRWRRSWQSSQGCRGVVEFRRYSGSSVRARCYGKCRRVAPIRST